MPANVTETITDGNGPVAGVKIEVSTYPGPAYDSAADDALIGTYSTMTDAQGAWSATLPVCSGLNPSGTVYLVVTRVGGRVVRRYIDVPSGGPHNVEDILTEAPGEVASSALQSHLADTAGAHAASAVSVEPFGTVAATNVQDALEEIVAEGVGGGATELDGLSDVTITDETTGDLLRYNGSAWVNYPDSNYADAGHDHDDDYDPAGTAAALVGALTPGDIGAEAAGVAAALVDDLSGVTNASTARTNLGLGSAAVAATGDFATAAQGATADGAVPKSLYDAHTILAATTDNTPVALTVAEQRVVGRVTGGNIDDLDGAALAGILVGGTAAVGKVPKVTDDDPLTLAWADDETGGGGSARPLTLADNWIPPNGRLVLGETSMSPNYRNVTYGPPWLCAANHRIVAVMVEVVTQLTNGVTRLGLVSLDPADGQPLALVADWGTVSTASTGEKTITGLTTDVVAGTWYATITYAQVGGGSAALRARPGGNSWGRSGSIINRNIQWVFSSATPDYTGGFANPPADWDSHPAIGNNLPGGYEAVLIRVEATP